MTKKQKNKCGNVKTAVNGIVFDSKREAKRYSELFLLQKCGIISNLELQKKYILIPTQFELIPQIGKSGKPIKPKKHTLEKECAYYADFVYFDNEKKCIVAEDAKGYRDPSSAEYAKFVIKRKLMLQIYGLRINEV